MARLEQIYYDRRMVDLSAVEELCGRLSSSVRSLIGSLSELSPARYSNLMDSFEQIDSDIRSVFVHAPFDASPPFTVQLNQVNEDGLSLVGGKAFNLALARNQLALLVPDGFVITTNAYHSFIETNRLRHRLDRALSKIDINSQRSLDSISREISVLISKARIPDDVEKAVHRALKNLQGEKVKRMKLSVRSSAVGEESDASFAGQYRTVLGVGEDDVLRAYKAVVATKYSPQALYYRICCGFSDQETPMAALILKMIDAKSSGVAYSRDPVGVKTDRIVIHIVPGLGEDLVSGRIQPSMILGTRDAPYRMEHVTQTTEPGRETVASDGSEREPVTPLLERQFHRPLLDDQTFRELVQWTLALEEFYNRPQDIEWCLDHDGELFILQTRPLHIEKKGPEIREHKIPEISNRLLISGGVTACGGGGTGVVFNIVNETQLQNIPEGSVLVAKHPSPDFVRFLGKLNAVVTDMGGIAGHFVSVAREFGVPALVNTQRATRDLMHGKIVTVHADRRAVYEGMVDAFSYPLYEKKRKRIENSPFMKQMKRIAGHISPLNLTDPDSKSFSPKGCKTFHDIIRFVHEMGVQEMFARTARSSSRAGGSKKMITSLPIALYLLDVGDGLRKDAHFKKEVIPEDLLCVPFKAVWEGLNHPDIYWDPKVKHFDWEKFDRMSGGIVRLDSDVLGSYAVLSHDYLNLSIHFGYHFVVLDVLCTQETDDNHIMIRFAGGGGDSLGRSLRLQFLTDILSGHGFTVTCQGDMMKAQLTREERKKMEKKLKMIGMLMGSTRLLDMALRNEAQVREMVEKFSREAFDFPSIHNPNGKQLET